MFKNAIVRKPSKSMVKGLTSANLGVPDYNKAVKQHEAYVEALLQCGLDITILDADENFPDSCFVEDVALCTPHCAIITSPGAESRRGEIHEMHEVLKEFYKNIEIIQEPGNIEAGDIMMVENHYYIGLSARTNQHGAEQMIAILEKFGMTASIVPLEEVLHLKTGLAYLENNHLVISGEFLQNAEFNKFNKIEINAEDAYSANCIWVNDTVIIPAGYPRTKKIIVEAGYSVKELEMSEFQKLDGGLSCLSIRF
jgi:dimethylargininase